MEKKKTSFLFKIIRFLVWLFSPKMKVEGIENLPEEPVLLVGNHSQMYGPITGEIYFGYNFYIWCAGEMMHLKEVPKYAFSDFWSQKPKYTHWFYKALSYIIAPISVVVFNNARTVGVYHDHRIISTFRNTVDILKKGGNVIVFPEHDEKYNNIIYDFQDKFIDIARMYYKKSGEDLSFVPLYIAPNLKKAYIGKAIKYNNNADKEEERRRICEYLMNEITEMGRSLPLHTVVPYRNIPKKDYPLNQGEI